MNTDTQGQYFVLDPAIQWLDSEIVSLSPVGDCGLAVDCVPGQPIEFASALMKRMGYPIGLAMDPARENLYLLDLRRSRVNTLNLAMQNQELAWNGIRPGASGTARKIEMGRSTG